MYVSYSAKRLIRRMKPGQGKDEVKFVQGNSKKVEIQLMESANTIGDCIEQHQDFVKPGQVQMTDAPIERKKPVVQDKQKEKSSATSTLVSAIGILTIGALLQ